jgi:pimeloyl-ACP methyl ester carboxylesterase
MPRARNGSVEIEYQSFGDDRPQTILLVNGLGSQMTRWPETFCEKLVARGYRAIRFDNRDTGLSTWPAQAYTLADMANDAVAVLDAAGVKKAHIAGVSMGGMIVQRMALDHPDRVLSMTSIMSATGAPGSLNSTPEAAAVLNTPPPDPQADYEAFVVHGVKNAQTIGSPAYPWTDEQLRARVIAEHSRAFNPAGRSAPDDGAARRRRPHRGAGRRQGSDCRAARRRRSPGSQARGRDHGGRHSRRRAAHHPGHGPRPAARPLRDLRRRHHRRGQPRQRHCIARTFPWDVSKAARP